MREWLRSTATRTCSVTIHSRDDRGDPTSRHDHSDDSLNALVSRPCDFTTYYVATQLLTAGIDVRTVAGRLGHAHPSTTLNVYAAFVPGADRDAAEIIGRLLQSPKPAAPRGRRTR